MLARTDTHALVNLEPRHVDVEVHIQRIPGIAIVDLADLAVQEAKHRTRNGVASAFCRSSNIPRRGTRNARS
jgi:predicted ATPase with chaperone activity